MKYVTLLAQCLVCFSVAKINHLPKPLGRGSVYLAYMPQSQFIILELEAKTWRQELKLDTMEECCLLTCKPWLLYLVCYTIWDHLSRSLSPPIVGWVLPL